MRSKSWLVILVMGIVAFCAMGFMTKFALESNPALVKIGKLKEAMAEDFSSQGIEKISVRTLPGKRGYEVRVESPRDRLPDPQAFARSVAQVFVRRFTPPPPPSVKVALLEPGGLGCTGPQPYLEKEFRTSEITSDLELRTAVQALESSLPAKAGLRLRPVMWGEPLVVAAELSPPHDEARVKEAMALLRAKSEEHLSAGRGRVVKLELWSPEPGAKRLGEETIDRHSPVRRRPSPLQPNPVQPAPAKPGPVTPRG